MPWGLKESDTTERLTLSHHFIFIKVLSLKSGVSKYEEIPKGRVQSLP